MIGEMAGDHLIDEGMTEGGGHWIEREKSDGGPPPRIGANRGTAGRLTSTHSVQISIFCILFRICLYPDKLFVL